MPMFAVCYLDAFDASWDWGVERECVVVVSGQGPSLSWLLII